MTLALAGMVPRRAPGWPLALTLAVHLLLGWWWLQASAVRSLPIVGPVLRTLFIVPVTKPVPEPVRQPAPAAAPSIRAVRPARVAEAIDVAPDRLTTPVVPADVPAAPDAPAVGESMAGRARLDAGAIDRELRSGKLVPFTPGDDNASRLARGFERARVDTARTVMSDSYTGPDGITIYRFRNNGRTYCRTGGDVKPSPFGAEGGGATQFDKAGGGGRAGLIACPGNAEFKRD